MIAAIKKEGNHTTGKVFSFVSKGKDLGISSLKKVNFLLISL
jgi:hypothetical protein